MFVIGKIFRNTYRDSIALMRVATELSQVEGVHRAEILMGTPANIANLQVRNMYTAELSTATPNDIIAAIQAENEVVATYAIKQVGEKLFQKKDSSTTYHKAYFSLDTALTAHERTNWVLLSIPGPYVKREALKSIASDKNLMIFSDNVTLADELEIKKTARNRDLLVMGPDCGTAILNGKGLGFANAVTRGPIGIVGASGTGIQEISCLIDQAGGGVSQCIGTGSNDIKKEVGGISFLKGIELLQHDPTTKVIVLVSKPPDTVVANHVITRANSTGKPVIVCFLGSEGNVSYPREKLYFADTLEDAADKALELAGFPHRWHVTKEASINQFRHSFSPMQKYVRGLFTGGTLAAESALLFHRAGLDISTNIKFGNLPIMKDPLSSQGNTCLDLGDDVFTQGKPHPMLDPIMRARFIHKEAKDPSVAVLLLDFVLGYGVHPDPVKAILPTLQQAFYDTRAQGRNLVVVTSVTGTESDPQMRSRQISLLEEIGCLVFHSNASATRFVIELISGL